MRELRGQDTKAVAIDLIKAKKWQGPKGLLVGPGKVRSNYVLVFLYGKASKFNEALVPFFGFNPKWVVPARLTASKEKQETHFVTTRGNDRIEAKYGVAEFEIDGKKIALDLYTMSSDASRLFLPFRDKTNGKSTYGGGRYIDVMNQVSREGILTIDFNRAYNPYCVYSKFFDCTVIDGNSIDLSVEAGAQMPATKQ